MASTAILPAPARIPFRAKFHNGLGYVFLAGWDVRDLRWTCWAVCVWEGEYAGEACLCSVSALQDTEWVGWHEHPTLRSTCRCSQGTKPLLEAPGWGSGCLRGKKRGKQAWAALASLSASSCQGCLEKRHWGGGEGGAGPGRSVWRLDSMFKILAAFLRLVLLGHLGRQRRKEGSQFEPHSAERERHWMHCPVPEQP